MEETVLFRNDLGRLPPDAAVRDAAISRQRTGQVGAGLMAGGAVLLERCISTDQRWTPGLGLNTEAV